MNGTEGEGVWRCQGEQNVRQNNSLTFNLLPNPVTSTNLVPSGYLSRKKGQDLHSPNGPLTMLGIGHRIRYGSILSGCAPGGGYNCLALGGRRAGGSETEAGKCCMTEGSCLQPKDGWASRKWQLVSILKDGNSGQKSHDGNPRIVVTTTSDPIVRSFSGGSEEDFPPSKVNRRRRRKWESAQAVNRSSSAPFQGPEGLEIVPLGPVYFQTVTFKLVTGKFYSNASVLAP
ncbi:hypothetical protein Bbelb_411560 [Branchiostoma belcheri]|nr:hypothetical protein Bbelb_411560 [Branchiostoma belcheri]